MRYCQICLNPFKNQIPFKFKLTDPYSAYELRKLRSNLTLLGQPNLT